MVTDFNFVLRKRLHDKIEAEYDVVPQLVQRGNSVGFNVDGQEVGRLEEKDGHLNYTFYYPGKQSFFPVFSS